MASIAIAGQLAQRLLSEPVARDELTKLVNWLLVWVVIANFGFVLMWLIGAPPRQPEIIAAGAIGLVVRNQPRWLQAAAFIAAMAYSIASYVAGMFNLALISLLHSLRFFMELNPAQSREYTTATVGLALLIGLGLVGLRRAQGFGDLRTVLVAILAVLSFAQLDNAMASQMAGHYQRTAVAGASFTSAVEQAGLRSGAEADRRNLMIVMVESLGMPTGNAEMERLLFARYRQPDVTARFELETGTSLYYSSTTAAEIRELCGRWGDYYELLETRDASCLPDRLRRAGFQTTAYHSFDGAFFDRERWYPHIGFQDHVFADALLTAGLAKCGGVFAGVCDRDVPRVLARKLKSADKPQFVYWLTVNSHMPVPPGENLNVDNCQRISPELAEIYPMICRQFAIWHDIDAALAREITAPDFPPTDILIVGDHMPPYFDRRLRGQFAPDRVPWLLLRWKNDRPATPASLATGGTTADPVRG